MSGERLIPALSSAEPHIERPKAENLNIAQCNRISGIMKEVIDAKILRKKEAEQINKHYTIELLSADLLPLAINVALIAMIFIPTLGVTAYFSVPFALISLAASIADSKTGLSTIKKARIKLQEAKKRGDDKAIKEEKEQIKIGVLFMLLGITELILAFSLIPISHGPVHTAAMFIQNFFKMNPWLLNSLTFLFITTLIISTAKKQKEIKDREDLFAKLSLESEMDIDKLIDKYLEKEIISKEFWEEIHNKEEHQDDKLLTKAVEDMMEKFDTAEKAKVAIDTMKYLQALIQCKCAKLSFKREETVQQKLGESRKKLMKDKRFSRFILNLRSLQQILGIGALATGFIPVLNVVSYALSSIGLVFALYMDKFAPYNRNTPLAVAKAFENGSSMKTKDVSKEVFVT